VARCDHLCIYLSNWKSQNTEERKVQGQQKVSEKQTTQPSRRQGPTSTTRPGQVFELASTEDPE
jgi:hypothetical protein